MTSQSRRFRIPLIDGRHSHGALVTPLGNLRLHKLLNGNLRVVGNGIGGVGRRKAQVGFLPVVPKESPRGGDNLRLQENPRP
ncbi:hypothetical protein [Corynebacterium mustelae]|uniref:hypothetical protein n=1 Tax=Corynebacterium mustelae TaxID=571915 RepID=UPI0011875716|nr:hypothetical protein [Corynebacterium mustelae]